MEEILPNKKRAGLQGIIAGDTTISLVDSVSEKLLYRGYSIDDLAKNCSFEEVSWLLFHTDLPNTYELDGFKEDLIKLREINPTIKNILETLPPTFSLMDAFRSIISILGHVYPEEEEPDPFMIAERVLGSSASMLCYWYYFHTDRTKIEIPSSSESLAAHILKSILQKEPTEKEIKLLNLSLILYAEHEFNASTFTVRTIASTKSDYYSAICGGIGALKGNLHGGANEAVLAELKKYRNVSEAEASIRKKIENKELIMGFGHRVYKKEDPRSKILSQTVKSFAKSPEQIQLFEIAQSIEKIMIQEKNLYPNVDYYSAVAYEFLNIPSFFFTPLFVMARLTGWTAHFYEQRSTNKIIRPISNYIGPSLRFVEPIQKRDG